ncbi:ABSCISIC ACID-INSENSITIVE 5-like protein 2 [Cajanus cajan]|uniref:ABSCISIC ACID-INSENSITIVE 5-like protein 2 n=1 Tax=Cajanus cajan TaxID=3821 RepID=UPI00098D9BA2|nr:ABSCISIC ACID-INSENSITIVE 5-like protein 2 [Cajanus cajan]
MGSQVETVQEPNTSTAPLARQGSLYNLTLDEVQSQLGNLGKPLGSMNLDELLKSVWSAEAGGEASGFDFGVGGGGDANMHHDGHVASLNPQGSLTSSRDLSKITVDEVWRDMQLKKDTTNRDRKTQERQATLGEMTLEDFLVKAGVVAESFPTKDSNGATSQHGQWMQYQQNMMGGYVAGHAIQQPFQVAMNLVLDAAYTKTPSSLVGGLSDTQTPGRKRVASGDVVEKTVERRQKRMIKNRESAARSRARKQAYTQELENKVSQLEEENERLRRLNEMQKALPSVPPPELKHQLRRTSSAIF